MHRIPRGLVIFSLLGLVGGAHGQAPAAPRPATTQAAPAPVAAPAAPAATAPTRAAANKGVVVIEIAGVNRVKGQLLGAIFRGEKGFPDEVKFAIASQKLPLREKRARFTFEIPPGEFAFAVHHDENSNFKMETGLFGIPSEGYGTSRDAKPNFGPPSYSDAKLKLAVGERKLIVVHMRY